LNNSIRSFEVLFLKFSNSAKSLKYLSFSCSKDYLTEINSFASLEGPFLDAVFFVAAFLDGFLDSSVVLIQLFFNSDAKVLPLC
jgi:hypothetical protein